MVKNATKITIPVEVSGLDEALEKVREIATILRRLGTILNNVP